MPYICYFNKSAKLYSPLGILATLRYSLIASTKIFRHLSLPYIYCAGKMKKIFKLHIHANSILLILILSKPIICLTLTFKAQRASTCYFSQSLRLITNLYSSPCLPYAAAPSAAKCNCIERSRTLSKSITLLDFLGA